MATPNRPMVPSFLRKLDDWLLRHQPAIWQTRVHLAFYYILLAAVLLSLICFMSFGDARRETEIGGWITFTVLVSILGLVFWLIYLLRFNVFKRFGQWKPADALVSFLFYLLTAAGLVSLNFIPPLVQTFRANQQYSDAEIINDINEINKTACLLEYDILPLDWTPDTCQVINNFSIKVEGETDRPLQQRSNQYTFIDTAELSNRLETRDSVVKLRDDLYIFYRCPNYQFIQFYRSSWGSADQILTSAAIYRKYLKTRPDNNRNELVARMNSLKDKWAVYDRYPSYYGYGDYNNSDYVIRIQQKYELNRVENGIDSALDYKHRFDRDQEVYWRFLIYPALILALLLFIFRNSTVRTFFLSLLTIVLLMIFTGLLMVSFRGGEGESFQYLLIFYYFLFAALGLSVLNAQKRTAIQGIGLNLFFLATPFLPLVMAAIYLERRSRDVVFNGLHGSGRFSEEPTLSDDQVLLLAEIAGAVLLLLMLQFLFRILYRKWYALPEN